MVQVRRLKKKGERKTKEWKQEKIDILYKFINLHLAAYVEAAFVNVPLEKLQWVLCLSFNRKCSYRFARVLH